MEQFEFHSHTSNPLTTAPREWVQLEPGISQLTLNRNPETGRATLLQRWEADTSNRIQNFCHGYVEEIFIAEGDLRDLKGRRSGTGEVVRGNEGGGEVWTKGCYAYRKPGMDHGPFRSERGCLMFIVVIPVGEGKGGE